MNGWLLDTNVIAEVSGAKPDPKVAKWIKSLPEHALYLSILTIGEYQKGIQHLPPEDKRRPRLQRAVGALEARFSGRVLSVSDEIVLRWGVISGELKRLTGHSPSVIDTLLAATAVEYSLYFATRNVAHVANSGAVVFNPWKDDPSQFPVQGWAGTALRDKPRCFRHRKLNQIGSMVGTEGFGFSTLCSQKRARVKISELG